MKTGSEQQSWETKARGTNPIWPGSKWKLGPLHHECRREPGGGAGGGGAGQVIVPAGRRGWHFPEMWAKCAQMTGRMDERQRQGKRGQRKENYTIAVYEVVVVVCFILSKTFFFPPICVVKCKVLQVLKKKKKTTFRTRLNKLRQYSHTISG